MRVALILERFDPRLGGQERSTREMAEALVAAGASVTVVCAESADATRAPTATDPSLGVHRVAVGKGPKAVRTVAFVNAAARYCAEAGFEIAHAIAPCPSASVYQPRGGTYVETIARSVERGASPIAKTWRRLTRLFNHKQRRLAAIEQAMLTQTNPPFVACGSEYVRRTLIAGFPGFPADRAVVVFNAVNTTGLSPPELAPRRAAARERLRLASDEAVVVFIAHNFGLKGLSELLTAMALRPAEWRLLVAGRGDFRPFARQVVRLGLKDRVVYAGAVDDPRDLYATGDVLAHPTWYDPCSRVVIEAAAAGLPVVTTRFNGAAEVLSNETGVVIDSPRDTHALTDGIDKCLTPEYRAAAMTSAADVRSRVSIERHARELMELYQRVLTDR
ncbi:MAG: glycosyltransferase family 4 protein [Phycisphaerales bacterium]|nr:glycosyltransferase family 4 protein [Phycisphaerales bacterium]